MEGELLEEQMRQLFAIKAKTVMRIPLKKKGSFLKEWGRSIYSLSPALTVSDSFSVQGDACMSIAGKPVALG